nr:ribonuclease H-like domain-containing protein [Tanacetum cinerariifolium]
MGYLFLRNVNLKFLRSLPSEWKTHILIWRNKTDLEDKSLDDLFNSLKIYESVVKHSSSIDDLEEMDLKWSPIYSRRTVVAEPQRRNVPVETSTSNALVSQCDGLEFVEARLLVYKQNESVLEENIKLLNIEMQLGDTALTTLRQKLDPTEKERDDLNTKLEKF